MAYGLLLVLVGYQPAPLAFLSAWTLAPASLLAEAGRARARSGRAQVALVALVSLAVWVGFLVAIGQVAYGKALLAGQPVAAALESAINYLDIGPSRRSGLMPGALFFLGIPATGIAGALLVRARRGAEGPGSWIILGSCVALWTLPYAIPLLFERGPGDVGFLCLWASFVGGLVFVGAWLPLYFIDWIAAPRDP